ncbi:MAG: hypothetical protein ABI548_29530 [Polyangiaceae bacterium]
MVGCISRGFGTCAFACCALLASARAHADALGPTLLEYQAPADCPTVADFQHSVQRRSARIRFVDEGSHDRALSISLRQNGAAVVGELRLVEADGSLRQRSLRFTSCAEAVEGLALVATVSLDPQALLESPQPAPPAASPPPPAPTPPKPQTQPAPRAEPPPAAPKRARSKGIATNLGAQFEAYLHLFPQAALGGEAYVDLDFRPAQRFSPLLRAAFTHLERRGIAEGSGEANFALTVGTLSVCPWRIRGALLEVRPCAWVSAGALRSWSSKTTKPQALTSQYWAWGGSAVAFVRLGKAMEIVADTGVGAPLLQDHFVFEGSTFWKTPTLYVSTGLGLRVFLQ